jgi:hypothetical protein
MNRLSDSNISNTRQNVLQSRKTPDCVPLHLTFDAGVVVLLTIIFASHAPLRKTTKSVNSALVG